MLRVQVVVLAPRPLGISIKVRQPVGIGTVAIIVCGQHAALLRDLAILDRIEFALEENTGRPCLFRDTSRMSLDLVECRLSSTGDEPSIPLLHSRRQVRGIAPDMVGQLDEVALRLVLDMDQQVAMRFPRE